VERLKEILAELDRANVPRGGQWGRFTTWLRSILQSREQSGNSWVDRFAGGARPSQVVLELVSYAALAAVVALAGFILVNELRTAGVLARGVFRRAGRRSVVRASMPPVGAGWDQVAGVSVVERPRLLLALIAARLSDKGYLPPSRALTVRELARTARLCDAEDSRRLAELALAAERVRFSGKEIPGELLAEPLARGRELLEKLDAEVSA
jgi:hypothetical protein